MRRKCFEVRGRKEDVEEKGIGREKIVLRRERERGEEEEKDDLQSVGERREERVFRLKGERNGCSGQSRR